MKVSDWGSKGSWLILWAFVQFVVGAACVPIGQFQRLEQDVASLSETTERERQQLSREIDRLRAALRLISPDGGASVNVSEVDFGSRNDEQIRAIHRRIDELRLENQRAIDDRFVTVEQNMRQRLASVEATLQQQLNTHIRGVEGRVNSDLGRLRGELQQHVSSANALAYRYADTARYQSRWDVVDLLIDEPPPSEAVAIDRVSHRLRSGEWQAARALVWSHATRGGRPSGILAGMLARAMMRDNWNCGRSQASRAQCRREIVGYLKRAFRSVSAQAVCGRFNAIVGVAEFEQRLLESYGAPLPPDLRSLARGDLTSNQCQLDSYDRQQGFWTNPRSSRGQLPIVCRVQPAVCQSSNFLRTIATPPHLQRRQRVAPSPRRYP